MKWLVSSMSGIVGLFLIFFGCLFMSIGGGVYYFTIASVRDWVEVPGVVTTFQVSTSTDSSGFESTTYCPWVEYTTTSGEAYEVYINECSSPPAYQVGETVRVLYNPTDPEQAQLRGGVRELTGNILGIIFGVVGCLPALIGLVLLVLALVAATRKSAAANAR